MTTDINEIYRKYPEAKKINDQNMEFWASQESLDAVNEPCVDVWMKTYESEVELYRFLQDLVAYDAFLLKENEIMPEDEMRKNKVIDGLMEKYLKSHIDKWYDIQDKNICEQL